MSDVVIRVENLSKCYTIRHQNGTGDGLRHAIHDVATAPLRWLRGWQGAKSEELRASSSGNSPLPLALTPLPSAAVPPLPLPLTASRTTEEFWALRDVSFEVKRGEVVGIIGRNGAGKTTLLKILSRITEPTEGRVRIRGRVASLLEVGTGFHPELTGRENIFLNGAILGMSRREIDRKFDQIVDFSGVEKFLDTPVKRYSSGMYVRLAFAVAAHLEPEILIIDEVLAVGDAEFQRKCLGKMEDVASEGRTVLFVSHNMAAVEGLCTSVRLLDNGRMTDAGDPATVIRKYLREGSSQDADVDLSENRTRQAGIKAVLTRLRVTNLDGEPQNAVAVGGDLRFEVHLVSSIPLRDASVAVILYGHLGQVVAKCYTKHQHVGRIEVFGHRVVACIIHDCRLAPGNYAIGLVVRDGITLVDRVESVATVNITASDIYETGKLPDPSGGGFYLPDARWEIDGGDSGGEIDAVAYPRG